jgi:hypothetical protein
MSRQPDEPEDTTVTRHTIGLLVTLALGLLVMPLVTAAQQPAVKVYRNRRALLIVPSLGSRTPALAILASDARARLG